MDRYKDPSLNQKHWELQKLQFLEALGETMRDIIQVAYPEVEQARYRGLVWGLLEKYGRVYITYYVYHDPKDFHGLLPLAYVLDAQGLSIARQDLIKRMDRLIKLQGLETDPLKWSME